MARKGKTVESPSTRYWRLDIDIGKGKRSSIFNWLQPAPCMSDWIQAEAN